MQYLHLLVNALPKHFFFSKTVALCTILTIFTSCNFFTEDNLVINEERPRIELDFDYDAFTITKLEEAGVYSGVAEEGIAALSRWERQALEKVSDLMSMSDLEDQSEAYHKEILKNFKVVEDERSKLLRSVLKQLVKTIDANGIDHPKWKIFLLKSKGFPVTNFFTSGSYIYATVPMFNLLEGNSNRIGLVLSHEIFHGLNGDLHQFRYREVASTKYFGQRIGKHIYNMYESAMSAIAQSQETLCDIKAVKLSYDSGFDVHDGLIAYYKLCQESDQNSNASRLLSSHQYINQRYSALCSVICTARIRAEEKNRLSFPN